ncbi:putative membrane protein [Clostridium bornimense]|uniref:Putative membrane protein n=1 Tax=Clostridium bornimense TaxID=1216932 RepID=W6S0A2_9CLOT|nr:prepilin-type N-terminal cleavage/methylation domain-containing protein [Clostridium bornimense]CDM67707.1 putative membrane protein [Clostridium bornimense]
MNIKKKKGATLLEIIISMAIITIIIIPISDLIMSSVKNNKNAEEEQDIKLLAQSISEKLKVSDIDIDPTTTEISIGHDEIKLNGSVGHYSVSNKDIGNGLTADITLDKRNDMPSNNIARSLNWDSVIDIVKEDINGNIYYRLKENTYDSTTKEWVETSISYLIRGNTISIINDGNIEIQFEEITDIHNPSNTETKKIYITRDVENDFEDNAGNKIEGKTGYIKFQIDDDIIKNKDKIKFEINNKEIKPIMINFEGEVKEPSDEVIIIDCKSTDEKTLTTYNSVKMLSSDERVGDAYNYQIIIKQNGDEVFKDTGIKNIK